MPSILIVDDEGPIRQLLQQMLEKEGYSCVQTSDGDQAKEILHKQSFELVLADINMPGESGLDLIRHLLAAFPQTAAIMITAVSSPEVAELALDIGAYDYIIKPFEKNRVLISVANALRRQRLEIENRLYRQKLEEMVSQRTEALNHALNKLKKTLMGTVRSMAMTVEARDPYTSGHQKRVGELGAAIAREMDLNQDQIEASRISGQIHDLGKISIPAEILSSPRRLSEDEFSLIKTHPRVGYNILKPVEFPWPMARIVLQHHERLDGSGYPQGLKDEAILVEAKILAVADVVEAISSHRPYRPALGLERALEEISQNRGRLYDPAAVEACLKIFSQRKFDLGLFSRKVSKSAHQTNLTT